jgi:hypothetical protein
MRHSRRTFLCRAAGAAALAGGQSATEGRFWRLWWCELGAEHGNPGFNKRFRVNSPETSLHPQFGSRSEARASGMMQIFMPEDPRSLEAVELYCELWGGHPGTANKRVSVNGRSLYALPENGTAAGHCTHLYPSIRLRRDDVVNGYNALQFACDRGSTFWGHFIVDNACLRAGLGRSHPDLKRLGLDGFRAAVGAAPESEERLAVWLECGSPEQIARVDFQGFYAGYDENGDGLARDWHGFTKSRQPEAWLGAATAAPFRIEWDAQMLAGDGCGVRARVTFREAPGIVYETAPLEPIPLPREPNARVACVTPSALPAPFWSRAGKRREAVIELPMPPRQVQRAHLHIVTWDGGRGAVEHPFRLNGMPVEVCGAGQHDVIYSVRELAPALLEKRNVAELVSDTDHHGIEVLLPGPALMVRYAD